MYLAGFFKFLSHMLLYKYIWYIHTCVKLVYNNMKIFRVFNFHLMFPALYPTDPDMLCFHFIQWKEMKYRHFKISFRITSVTYSLFNAVLFNPQKFILFQFHFLLISSFIPLYSGQHALSILLYLLKLSLCPTMWVSKKKCVFFSV